jgi:hypothetical protein
MQRDVNCPGDRTGVADLNDAMICSCLLGATCAYAYVYVYIYVQNACALHSDAAVIIARARGFVGKGVRGLSTSKLASKRGSPRWGLFPARAPLRLIHGCEGNS